MSCKGHHLQIECKRDFERFNISPRRWRVSWTVSTRLACRADPTRNVGTPNASCARRVIPATYQSKTSPFCPAISTERGRERMGGNRLCPPLAVQTEGSSDDGYFSDNTANRSKRSIGLAKRGWMHSRTTIRQGRAITVDQVSNLLIESTLRNYTTVAKTLIWEFEIRDVFIDSRLREVFYSQSSSPM